jgi:acyl dehydratase
MKGIASYAAGEGLNFTFSVSMEDQADFARLSGDSNAMHLDPLAAQKLGFPAPVVYGGLLVAKLSRVVGMQWPGPGGIWADLDIRFRKPLFVGEEAVLSATIDQVSAATRSMTIKAEINSQTARIASATILAVLFPEADS